MPRPERHRNELAPVLLAGIARRFKRFVVQVVTSESVVVAAAANAAVVVVQLELDIAHGG
jgi:hypothetical protein